MLTITMRPQQTEIMFRPSPHRRPRANGPAGAGGNGCPISPVGSLLGQPRSLASSSGDDTIRYARFAQTMATEQRVSMILGMFTLISRIIAAATPVTRAGTIGVRVSCLNPGQVSRAGQGCCRGPSRRSTEPCWPEPPAHTHHREDHDSEEDIAKLATERFFDDQWQSAGDFAELRHCGIADGQQSGDDEQPPGKPRGRDARSIAKGARRRGSKVSSARVPAVSNP